MFREYYKDDFDELLRLRCLLFFDHTAKKLHEELTDNLQGDKYYDLWTMFVYQRENGDLGGFVEIGFINAQSYDRLENFNGTVYFEQIQEFISLNRPIPVVESWYVDEDLRGKRIGFGLMLQAELWVKNNGCPFILSDTDDFRDVSIKAHKSFGYDNYNIDENGCCLFYKQIV